MKVQSSAQTRSAFSVRENLSFIVSHFVSVQKTQKILVCRHTV